MMGEVCRERSVLPRQFYGVLDAGVTGSGFPNWNARSVGQCWPCPSVRFPTRYKPIWFKQLKRTEATTTRTGKCAHISLRSMVRNGMCPGEWRADKKHSQCIIFMFHLHAGMFLHFLVLLCTFFSFYFNNAAHAIKTAEYMKHDFGQ